MENTCSLTSKVVDIVSGDVNDRLKDGLDHLSDALWARRNMARFTTPDTIYDEIAENEATLALKSELGLPCGSRFLSCQQTLTQDTACSIYIPAPGDRVLWDYLRSVENDPTSCTPDNDYIVLTGKVEKFKTLEHTAVLFPKSLTWMFEEYCTPKTSYAHIGERKMRLDTGGIAAAMMLTLGKSLQPSENPESLDDLNVIRAPRKRSACGGPKDKATIKRRKANKAKRKNRK